MIKEINAGFGLSRSSAENSRRHQRRNEDGLGWGTKQNQSVSNKWRILIGWWHMVLPDPEAGGTSLLEPLVTPGQSEAKLAVPAAHPQAHPDEDTSWRNKDPGLWKLREAVILKSWPKNSPYILRRNVMWCWEKERRREKSKHFVLISEMLCLNNSIWLQNVSSKLDESKAASLENEAF